MGKQPITSCEAAQDEATGLVEYSINGVRATREDFVALQLARIAGALEADLQEEEDDGEDDGEDLFGQRK